MDTSETYAKMHLALPKSMREEPMEGDYFFNTSNGDSGKLGEVYFDTSKMIRLYEQDQLQEMSGLSWYLFDKTCVTWATTNPDYQRESKEMVGLRVVIKENHNKVWDGDKWR